MHQLRKSRFTITLPVNFRNESFFCFYHTMTGAFALVPEEEGRRFHINSEIQGHPDTIEFLHDQGFLIRSGIDEKTVFDCWHQQHVHDFSLITSKVLVTRKCNNRCRYCILKPQFVDMKKDIAIAMDRFYMEIIDEKKPVNVRDDFIGGEPLLNVDIILEIAGRRYQFCVKKNIKYGFTITTNGTLLSPSLIQAMNRLGLEGVRVSMAGPAAVHDFLRPSSNGRGTFDKIMANLETVSGLTPLTIECQYASNHDDYKQIPEMMDAFKEKNIDIAEIFFTPILARRSAGDYNDAGIGDPEIMVFLNQAAEKRGYAGTNEVPSCLCKADFRSMFVFDTNGSIIPCPSVQEGELAYGDVFNGIDFVSEALLIKRELPEKCIRQCDILPVCMGGCRLQALIKQNSFSGIECQYDSHRFFLENYIRKKAIDVLAKSAM